MRDKIVNERIRAGGVVRRIGQCQDVLILANGESLDLVELRVLEFLAEFRQEVVPARLIVFEGHAQTFHRPLRFDGGGFREQR